MKYILGILLCFHISLTASIVDEFYIMKAQNYYLENNLNKSLEFYNKVKEKNAQIYYNMGNILYQKTKYKEAIKYYNLVKSSKLEYKKQHNLGNTYFKLNDMKNAIQSYQQAIEINHSVDTIKNLNMVKDLVRLQKKQDDKESSDKNNTVGYKFESLLGYGDSDVVSKEGKENNISEIIIRKNNISQMKTKNIKENIKIIDFNTEENVSKILDHTEYFSQLEERKWDHLLKNREMHSLIIPLNTTKVEDENITYPW